MAVRQPLLFEEFLNGRIGAPLAIIDFITADMQIRIGEDSRQFADHRLGKRVGGLFCWVENRFQHTPVALHRVRPRRAHQLRISHGDRRGVARHIDFRHHANTAFGGIAHNVFHLRLGIKQAVAGLLLQLRIAAGGEAPALIVGQMPVQYVKLRRRHTINLPLDRRQRHKVTGGIQQQSTPREARRIVNGDIRNGGAVRAVLYQL